MQKTPWTLVFVSVALSALAGLALLPQPSNGDGFMVEKTAFDKPIQTDLNFILPDSVETPRASREVVPQGLTIRLHVVDQDGHPLPEARILCNRIETSSIGLVAQGFTDAHGDFSSRPLQAGVFHVQVRCPTYVAGDVLKLRLPVDGGHVQTVRLQRGSVIRGTLQGTDRLPRNHGLLFLSSEATGEQLQIKPDAEGRFQFPAVAEGDWELTWCSYAGANTSSALQHSIQCRAGVDPAVLVTLPTLDTRAATSSVNTFVGIQLLPIN
jgi:hypothetical protein